MSQRGSAAAAKSYNGARPDEEAKDAMAGFQSSYPSEQYCVPWGSKDVSSSTILIACIVCVVEHMYDTTLMMHANRGCLNHTRMWSAGSYI